MAATNDENGQENTSSWMREVVIAIPSGFARREVHISSVIVDDGVESSPLIEVEDGQPCTSSGGLTCAAPPYPPFGGGGALDGRPAYDDGTTLVIDDGWTRIFITAPSAQERKAIAASFVEM